jgi:hypothetical protein
MPRRRADLELDPAAYDDPDTHEPEPVEGVYQATEAQDEVEA